MLFSLALFCSVATAKVLDSLPSVPLGWSFVRNADGAEAIGLKVALHQQHADRLEQVVLDVSTPGHPNYGLHLTRDELRKYTAPTADAVEAATGWLQEHGISSSKVDNDWISFTTTVEKANALLDTEFAWYQYEGNNDGPVLRTLAYSVPDELLGLVDLVQPTTRFGQLATRKSTIFDLQYLDEAEVQRLSRVSFQTTTGGQTANTSCTNGVTPACLKSMYGINYTVKNPEDNKVAFASYLEQYARYSDLDTFEEKFVPEALDQNFTVELINGGRNDQNSTEDSGEANLDLQYILGISHPIPIVEYSTGGRGPLVPTPDQPTLPGSNEPYLEFLEYMLGLDDDSLPQTLSTSYGEEEQSVPEEYALKVCNMFMQLGARGVSVLFSSGDSGPGDTCVRVSDDKPYFQPTFPAGCPYVTAVGATHDFPERGIAFSSGGFSTLHARPAWQDAPVKQYLRSINGTYSAFFNASNRAFPDVSAQGSNFLVYDQGSLGRLAGTSASAPVVAGVIALLNAARRSEGIPPLGFLNPWIYHNTEGWNDVATGAGTGCTNTTYFPSTASWNATAGWDPVTGLGTPNFPVLLEAAAPGVKNE